MDLEDISVDDIKKIKGFSDKTALVVVSGLKDLESFLKVIHISL